MGSEPRSETSMCKDSTTKSGNKKNRRRRRGKMCLVQTLFETCKQVFANAATGFVPSSHDVQSLCSILDSLKPGDVGLSPDMPYFRATKIGHASIITYIHLYERENFSMGIFCLPPGGVIPLHNHPGMTVFSKLLFGTMHVKSYDWVKDVPCSTSISNTNSESVVRLAKEIKNGEMIAPCNTSILYPEEGGNIHRFKAVTSCAVLDVLGPPYNDSHGRHCAYYKQHPFQRFSVDLISLPKNEDEGYAWLQEKEKPQDLIVVRAPYEGPNIKDLDL